MHPVRAGSPHRRTTVRLASVVSSAIALQCVGCSLVFTSGPPPRDERPPPPQPIDCSTSRVPPLLDTACAGFQVFRSAMAATASNSDYANAPISRNADIAAGAILFGLFAVSATHGYIATADCDDAKDDRAREIRRPQNPVPGQVPAATHPAPQVVPAVPLPTVAPTSAPQPVPPLPNEPSAPAADGGADLSRQTPF